ncbi:Os04g0682600, partial [Oryza sativa Japonica Group]
VKYPGLLQPLEVPSQSWQVITMDFIEGLPRSASFDCILVIVDKFSKFAHFFTPETPLYCLWSGSAFHGTYS